MLLQKLILAEDAAERSLYYRGETKLPAGRELSFDTYFNSFSYTKYRDYTRVSGVSFRCKLRGEAKVQLCVFDGAERVLREELCVGEAELSADFSELPGKGFVFARILALKDCEFLGGGYYAPCEPRKINCCIAICTHKREQYVLKNIELLKKASFSFINRVFVVDNGNTLDCNALNDELISVLPNKNYGGSGGFTRGLIEAYDGGFSHVILMDDDVEFHPETMEQMTVFVSALREECSEDWFSAAMLPLDKPWEQYEMGASWNGRVIFNSKSGADVRKREALIDNLDNDGIQYGAWWCLCMPVSVVEKQGLPYPFFIKYDDVEYGLRKPLEVRVITANGIAVRHEAFDKKLSMMLEYYILRNKLVVDAVYGYSVFTAVRIFLYEAGKNLILYRYDNIPVIFRAVRDFLQGVDFFLRCDEERLNGELIAQSPKLVPLADIPEWSEDLRCDEHQPIKRLSAAVLLTLGGHLIPSFLLKKEICAVPLSRCGTRECFGRKAVIQYQLGGSSGILTRRSFAKFLKYGFLTVGNALRLLVCFPRARKQYLRRKDEITSMEFWKAHLGK